MAKPVLASDDSAERLERDLKQAIAAGTLAPDTKLTGLRTIAKQYGITYAKAHRVVKKLESQGILVSRHGGGTYVAERPGEVVSRETFLEEVWNMPGSLATRTVDNFMRKLRQTFEENPSKPRHITSIRGAGYRFVP